MIFSKKQKIKVFKIYSNFSEKNKDNYNYYELMELGEKDWEKEINSRRTLSLLQKNHITHRDIKP